MKRQKHIASDNEKKLVLRVLFFQMADGVDRIAYVGQGNFVVADGDVWHVLKGKLAHIKTLPAACRNSFHILLKWGNSRWHYYYFVKPQPAVDLFHKVYVTVVRRVEASAENSPAHYFALRSIFGFWGLRLKSTNLFPMT